MFLSNHVWPAAAAVGIFPDNADAKEDDADRYEGEGGGMTPPPTPLQSISMPKSKSAQQGTYFTQTELSPALRPCCFGRELRRFSV